MHIIRDGYHPIRKERIDTFIDYDSINLDYISILLNQVIENHTYSTFDLIKLVKDNYNGNIKDTIESLNDYSNVRFNCYYAAKKLKEELSKLGIDAKYVTYKSIGFSSPFGDELIKEAHISLVIPTIKNNKEHYIILDPGYRIPSPLEFHKNSKQTNINVDNDDIIIQKRENILYPYSMKMEGYNRYSLNKSSYFCEEFFNCDYETLNPEEMLFPISFTVLSGYRLINYHIDKSKCAMLKVMILDEYLEVSDSTQDIILTFAEIRSIPLEELYRLLTPFCKKLNQDTNDFLDLLFFILEHHKEFINEVISKEVIKELKAPKIY